MSDRDQRIVEMVFSKEDKTLKIMYFPPERPWISRLFFSDEAKTSRLMAKARDACDLWSVQDAIFAKTRIGGFSITCPLSAGLKFANNVALLLGDGKYKFTGEQINEVSDFNEKSKKELEVKKD